VAQFNFDIRQRKKLTFFNLQLSQIEAIFYVYSSFFLSFQFKSGLYVHVAHNQIQNS